MLRKLLHYLIEETPLRYLLDLTRKIIIPGFDGMPLYNVGHFFISAVRKGSLNTRATSLAYKFFLAMFPFILFLFTLIPYFPVPHFQDTLLEQLQAMMPGDSYSLLSGTIEDIVNNQRGGLLSFGLLMALYFATNGVMAVMNAFNESFLEIERRNVIMQRLVAILLCLILTSLLLTAITLLIFGENLIHSINLPHSNALLDLSRWIIILALFYFSISFLYFMGPSRKTKWKFFSAGSSLSTALGIAVSSGFAWYVHNFGKWNKLYGSIGTLIVLLLWFYFMALILLIGFELNASIASAKKRKVSE